VTVIAIVLAGGRSERFGGDKLAAELDGLPILERTIRAVSPVADEVIVVGPAAGGHALTPGDDPITVVTDAEPFEGPLAALAGVLDGALRGRGGIALVVGGDMPRLVVPVLAAMIETLDVDPTVDAVYLGRPEAARPGAATGTNPHEPLRRAVLPLAVRVQPASRAAREAVQAGRRSLQALLERMAAVDLPPAAWIHLDPAAMTLADVDTPEDLDRLRAP
jgi:molybdopterin-guanine dinucleotide biosynthesis protein A